MNSNPYVSIRNAKFLVADRRLSLATLSFQGAVMYWRTSLVKDNQLHRYP